ncbi:MAG: hypothetical protein ACI9CV_000476 [Ilumatobacter sp.]|jgi:hypothetical protein
MSCNVPRGPWGLVLTLLVVGCAADRTKGTVSSPADSMAPPMVDAQAAVAAAVDVRADGCGPRIGFGTGTVISGGDIVTAAHVVAGSTSVEVIDRDGERAAAEVVLFDPDLDLAVLRPATALGIPLTIRSTEARENEVGVLVRIRERDGVMEIEQVDVRVVREANISTTDIYLERKVIRDGFELESSIDTGDSGAMVVLPGGGAGIVWARSNRVDGRAWAIDLPSAVVDGTAISPDVTANRNPVDVGQCIPR